MRYKKRKYFLAGRINLIHRSKIRELFEKASKMEDVISLGIGEPDFDTPKVIKEAAKSALDDGYTHYTPNAGIPEFREAIADYYNELYGMDVDVNNIIVTAGAYEATYLAFQTLLESGDDVIIPDPAFVSYVEDAKIAEAGIIRIPLREENRFRLNPDELVEAITKRTRMIVINYPNNPTSAVLDKRTIRAIGEIAQDYNIYVLSDEPYEHFLYEGAKHHPMLKYAPDNTVLANSFSKTFAMTGWRLGYAIGPSQIIRDMVKLHAYVIGNVASFVQIAGITALRDERSWEAVRKMRETYCERRRIVLDYLSKIPHVEPFRGKGTFYTWVKIDPELDMTSEDFADYILENASVVVIPGVAFGEYGDGYVRISYATKKETLIEAMERMGRALENI